MSLPASVLHTTKNRKSFRNEVLIDGHKYLVKAEIRFDDTCRNGHNSFCITGETLRWDEKIGLYRSESCGRCDEEIALAFPHLAPFQKWNNVSTDGPMHYVSNSLYWAGKTKWEGPNLKHFRSVAVWPEATEETMNLPEEELKAKLLERLPAIMEDFKKDVESLGFVY